MFIISSEERLRLRRKSERKERKETKETKERSKPNE